MAKLVSKIKEIWHDRKRFLGMPITFTRYALSEDRFFVRKGLLNLQQEVRKYLPAYRIFSFSSDTFRPPLSFTTIIIYNQSRILSS